MSSTQIPRTPTQIDVFVVTETVTDVPQTMDAAKVSLRTGQYAR